MVTLSFLVVCNLTQTHMVMNWALRMCDLVSERVGVIQTIQTFLLVVAYESSQRGTFYLNKYNTKVRYVIS